MSFYIKAHIWIQKASFLLQSWEVLFFGGMKFGMLTDMAELQVMLIAVRKMNICTNCCYHLHELTSGLLTARLRNDSTVSSPIYVSYNKGCPDLITWSEIGVITWFQIRIRHCLPIKERIYIYSEPKKGTCKVPIVFRRIREPARSLLFFEWLLGGQVRFLGPAVLRTLL